MKLYPNKIIQFILQSKDMIFTIKVVIFIIIYAHQLLLMEMTLYYQTEKMIFIQVILPYANKTVNIKKLFWIIKK